MLFFVYHLRSRSDRAASRSSAHFTPGLFTVYCHRQGAKASPINLEEVAHPHLLQSRKGSLMSRRRHCLLHPTRNTARLHPDRYKNYRPLSGSNSDIADSEAGALSLGATEACLDTLIAPHPPPPFEDLILFRHYRPMFN